MPKIREEIIIEALKGFYEKYGREPICNDTYNDIKVAYFLEILLKAK